MKTRYKVIWVDKKGEVRVNWTETAKEKELSKLTTYISAIGGTVSGTQITSQMPPKAPRNVGAGR